VTGLRSRLNYAKISATLADLVLGGRDRLADNKVQRRSTGRHAGQLLDWYFGINIFHW
jgi:hypothetical protein